MRRALVVLLKNFKVIMAHFESVIATRSSTAEVIGRAKYITKALKQYDLLLFMHFLLDCLEAVATFSLQVEKDSTTLSEALDALETLNLQLITLTQRPGKNLQHFHDTVEIEEKKFNEINLNNLPDENDPDEAAAVEARRKLQMQQIVEGIMDCVHSRCKDIDTGPLLRKMRVVFPMNWPDDEVALALFGEQEIDDLCHHFETLLQRMGCDIAAVPTEWQALKVTLRCMGQGGNNNIPVDESEMYARIFNNNMQERRLHNVMMLIEIILVIPVSTAVCERGFSAMKRIKSDWRSSLSPEMLDTLMLISLEGPSYQEFRAEDAVTRWWFSG